MHTRDNEAQISWPRRRAVDSHVTEARRVASPAAARLRFFLHHCQTCPAGRTARQLPLARLLASQGTLWLRRKKLSGS